MELAGVALFILCSEKFKLQTIKPWQLLTTHDENSGGIV